jgi:hypothetical protein
VKLFLLPLGEVIQCRFHSGYPTMDCQQSKPLRQ